ncbi:MAG: chromate efflux transporter [Vicinamibacteria bacterium]
MTNLRELGLLFLRLGATTFGGPAAHIAVMEDEVVRRRGWLTRQQFLDLLGAAHLVPGPNSTEMAIHVGYLRAGFPGLLVAGAAFILPAALMALGLAWAYLRFRSVPAASAVLYGVKPVVVAVVVQALWSLGRTAISTKRLLLLAIAALAANALGVNELLVLVGTGALAVMSSRETKATTFALALPLLLAPAGVAAPTAAALFLFFLKAGSVLYGSGYVLLAFLRSDLVVRYRWLTEAELLDAIAITQLTPGPVFTVATFIGYLLDGLEGALVATLGIFLPAFFFVAVSGPLVARIRASPALSAFLDGVIAASLSLMAVVAFELGRGSLVDPLTFLIAIASAVALVRYRVNSTWLILGGAIISLLAWIATR